MCLLLKARIKRTAESKDKVEEEDDDPLPTLAGPRSSDRDIRVPKVKQQTADSAEMPLAGGNKSSHMPHNKDDTPNGGTLKLSRFNKNTNGGINYFSHV